MIISVAAVTPDGPAGKRSRQDGQIPCVTVHRCTGRFSPMNRQHHAHTRTMTTFRDPTIVSGGSAVNGAQPLGMFPMFRGHDGYRAAYRLRHVAGGTPATLLNARLNAASES
jgi:hypothetical protein